jgi:hypothetical protein
LGSRCNRPKIPFKAAWGTERAARAIECGTERSGGHGVHGTEPGADCGTDCGAELGADWGAELGADCGVDAGTECGADPGTDPGADCGVEHGAAAADAPGSAGSTTVARTKVSPAIK